MLTGDVGGGASSTDHARTEATSTHVSFSPGFDCFVASGFSLGLAAHGHRTEGVAFTAAGTEVESTSMGLGLGARFGGNVPLSRWFSLYPRFTLAIGRNHLSLASEGARNASSDTSATATLQVPLLVHVASHAFVGFGPVLQRDLMRQVDGRGRGPIATRFGAALTIGGWL